MRFEILPEEKIYSQCVCKIKKKAGIFQINIPAFVKGCL